MTDGTGAALHVRGVVLPEEEHRDLWVRDGLVTYEPVPDATTVATGWVVPGLVDAHCHIGLDAGGAVPAHVAEAQARSGSVSERGNDAIP